MRRFVWALAVLFAAFAGADAPAQQSETRIALIIANETYASAALGRLPGTQRDAALMRDALTRAGFEVTVRANLNRTDMRNALISFARRLGQLGENGVGFLYYSGHGMADDPNGRNYLIPVDADIAALTDLPIMALPLNEQLEAIELARARATIIVIDACRNTPVSFGRSGSRGLAPVNAVTDTLIAFSTQPGAVAADDSIYAQVLAAELAQPGADSAAVFQRVQSQVIERTTRRQRPRYDNGLSSPIVFVPGAPAPPPNTSAAAPPSDPRLDAIRALLAPVSLAGAEPSEELRNAFYQASNGNAVYFDFEQATLRPEAQMMLDQQARWLLANPSVRARVYGNADERETEDALLLGSQRAKAVRDYLIGAGVPAERIGSTTYGLDSPHVNRSDETAWVQNRRADTRVVSVVSSNPVEAGNSLHGAWRLESGGRACWRYMEFSPSPGQQMIAAWGNSQPPDRNMTMREVRREGERLVLTPTDGRVVAFEYVQTAPDRLFMERDQCGYRKVD